MNGECNICREPLLGHHLPNCLRWGQVLPSECDGVIELAMAQVLMKKGLPMAEDLEFTVLRRTISNSINRTPREREELEKRYGQVWDTEQLKADFEVHGFLAPFCGVTRKSDNTRGALMFQHQPRYYWGFVEDALDDHKD